MSAKVVAAFWVSGNKSFAVSFSGKVPKSTFSSQMVHRDQAKSPVDQRVFILDDLGEAYVLVKKSNFEGKNEVVLVGVFFATSREKNTRHAFTHPPTFRVDAKSNFCRGTKSQTVGEYVCLVRLFSDSCCGIIFDYFKRTLRRSFSINFPHLLLFPASQVFHLI